VSSVKQVSANSEIDERLSALLTNAGAIRAIASAVEGTIGPKGLDTMLVDQFGNVIVTNDGVTILEEMDVNHPAARMLINIAKAQEQEIGDGTTTATIMAGALVSEGVNQAIKGVPVSRIIEGVKIGIKKAQEEIEKRVILINDLQSPLLRQIAQVAGREKEEIAQLVLQAARLVGESKLKEPGFKLAEMVKAVKGAENQAFPGILLNKERMNKEMPREMEEVKVLVIDDALEPEEMGEDALATETGFNKYLELQVQFADNLHKIVSLGVKLVLVDRGAADLAEEILTDQGVMLVQRVANSELKRAAEHTGARMIKRTALKKSLQELANYLGYAQRVYEDEKLEQIRILEGRGKPLATILVSAATEEVLEEQERITKDAASAVQAAFKGGVVAGGGAIELAVSQEIEKIRRTTKGMGAYGVECVVEALKKPLSQIVTNAGFNALEALGDVLAAQAETGKDSLGINCDNGQVADMLALGVVDPALVKLHALGAAGEVAEAILRINTIIKKRDEKVFPPGEKMDF